MISGIRFRNEGALVVLQVVECGGYDHYGNSKKENWRDAATEDLLAVAGFLADAYAAKQEQMPISVGYSPDHR